MMAVSFVIVAAAATLLRVLAIAGQPRSGVPWRTFGVNVLGSFALGLIASSGWIENPVVFAVAGLGSFTTFSTVASEAASLIDDRRKVVAIIYVGLTLVVGIAAAWLGLIIGEIS